MADEGNNKSQGDEHDESVNKGRRRFLTASTAVIGAAGAGLIAVPFVKTWLPSARAESLGAPIKISIAKIEPGQAVFYEWRKQPICVINRTPEQLKWLSKQDPRLRDPESKQPQQPKYCQNPHRSIKKEWMVLIDICTHLGCEPHYKGEVKPEPFDPNWKGGFFCPCHHSRYDLAARVYKGVPAPLNMVVPPYHFIDETHIEIGVNPKGAA